MCPRACPCPVFFRNTASNILKKALHPIYKDFRIPNECLQMSPGVFAVVVVVGWVVQVVFEVVKVVAQVLGLQTL